MNCKILIMAGGTGGHIFPGLAVASRMVEDGWEICWLGTSERMEARLVPEHGYKIRFISVAAVRGKGILKLLLAPVMVLRSIIQAVRVIRDEQPAVVLGLGGFASGPGGIAAWLLGKPMVLHEQNAVAGMTNRILANFSKKVLMAFPNTFNGLEKAVLVGNPIRKEISELATEQMATFDDNRAVNLLILGGSLGAQALNIQVPQLLAQTRAAGEISIWHQSGRGNQMAVEQQYQQLLAQNDNVRVDEFINDMTSAYRWADLVICRAGALTVAEVAAAGIGAVFVPFPHAVDDHQTLNAGWLANQGAAIIIPQDRLLDQQSCRCVNDLLDDKAQIQKMAAKARKLAIVDATEKVAEYCKTLANPCTRR